jgi:hypothetical protein
MSATEKQREEINRKLVTMQMEMIGKTYQDAMDTPEFWRVYTLTTEQREAWYKQALALVKKTFKINATKAKSIIDFFELQLGLRVYDSVEVIEHDVCPGPHLEDLAHAKRKHKPELTLWQKIKKFFIGYV